MLLRLTANAVVALLLAPAVDIVLGVIAEVERVHSGQLGVPFLETPLVDDEIDPLLRTESEVVVTLAAHAQLLFELQLVGDNAAVGTLLPETTASPVSSINPKR